VPMRSPGRTFGGGVRARHIKPGLLMEGRADRLRTSTQIWCFITDREAP
jgi:hypothetical protein